MNYYTNTIVYLILPLFLPIYANATLSSDYIDQIPLMTDNQLRDELESTKKTFDKINTEYQELRKNLENIKNKFKEEPLNKDLSEQYQDITEKKNAKGKNELQPVENKMQLLQREWDRRMNIPEDYKEYENLRRYLSEKYLKGVGTREEMATKYVELAEKFPDSPIAINALFDAAILYTGGCIRDNGIETRLPEKAREYHERIVSKYPDLLSEFVVWSRGELATLYPTSDERFEGQLRFYNWLKNIKPEQYESTMEFMRKDYRHRNQSNQSLTGQIDGLLKVTTDTLKKNIVFDARASSNQDDNMKKLKQLFESESAEEVKPVTNLVEVEPISSEVKTGVNSVNTEPLNNEVESNSNPVKTEMFRDETNAIALWSRPQFIIIVLIAGFGVVFAGSILLIKKRKI